MPLHCACREHDPFRCVQRLELSQSSSGLPPSAAIDDCYCDLLLQTSMELILTRHGKIKHILNIVWTHPNNITWWSGWHWYAHISKLGTHSEFWWSQCHKNFAIICVHTNPTFMLAIFFYMHALQCSILYRKNLSKSKTQAFTLSVTIT